MPEDKAGTGEAIPFRVWVLLGGGLLSLGASAILIRYASSVPGLAIASWRTLIVTAVTAPILWRQRADLSDLSRIDWLWVVGAGVVLGAHFIAWIESLYFTSVASASVLVTSSPLFIAVLGWIFLRERLHPRTIVAIGVAVVGAVLIGLSDVRGSAFENAMLGNALALLAAFLVSVYLLIGRAVRQRVSFWAYFVPLNGVAAITTTSTALATGVDLTVPWPVFGLCAVMALGPGLLGHGSFNYAVKFISAAILGLLTLTEPVVAAFLAWGLFGEVPTGLGAVGMSLVLSSVGIVMWRRRRREEA